MDADDVFEIIMNVRTTYDQADRLVIKILAAHENALGDVPDPSSPEFGAYLDDLGTYDLCKEIGEAIRDDLIKPQFRRQGVNPDRERTLADCLTSRALGSVSWTDAGRRFFQHAREAYAGYVADLLAAADLLKPGSSSSSKEDKES